VRNFYLYIVNIAMSKPTFLEKEGLADRLPVLPLRVEDLHGSAERPEQPVPREDLGVDPPPPYVNEALADRLPVLPLGVENLHGRAERLELPAQSEVPGVDLPRPRDGQGVRVGPEHEVPAGKNFWATLKQALLMALIGTSIMLWSCGFSYLTWMVLGSPEVQNLGIANVVNRVTNPSDIGLTAPPADLNRDRHDGAKDHIFNEVQRDVGDFLASVKQQFVTHLSTQQAPKIAVKDNESRLPPGVRTVSVNEDWLPLGVTRL
jgi:hypothetical protein